MAIARLLYLLNRHFESENFANKWFERKKVLNDQNMEEKAPFLLNALFDDAE
jgi:hypothetical protein